MRPIGRIIRNATPETRPQVHAAAQKGLAKFGEAVRKVAERNEKALEANQALQENPDLTAEQLAVLQEREAARTALGERLEHAEQRNEFKQARLAEGDSLREAQRKFARLTQAPAPPATDI